MELNKYMFAITEEFQTAGLQPKLDEAKEILLSLTRLDEKKAEAHLTGRPITPVMALFRGEDSIEPLSLEKLEILNAYLKPTGYQMVLDSLELMDAAKNLLGMIESE
jgi:hypothetical protein